MIFPFIYVTLGFNELNYRYVNKWLVRHNTIALYNTIHVYYHNYNIMVVTVFVMSEPLNQLTRNK